MSSKFKLKKVRTWISAHRADLFVLLTFAILACIYWYPLPLYFRSRQLEWPVIDPAFNQWIMGWGNHALTHYPWRFFEANMFYPFQHTLSWGDTLFSITIFAVPLIPLFGLLGAYNILLITSSALSAFAAYLLVHYLTKHRPAAIIAGLMWGFSYYRYVEYGHIQAISTQWIPLVFLYAEKIRLEFSKKNLILFIIFTFLMLATNLYLALFTIISFLIYFACLLAMRQINGKLLLRLVLGWLISGTVALPLYLPSILLQLHHPLIRDYNNQVSITLQGVLTWSRHDSFSIGLVSWVLIGVTLAKLWIDRKKITKTWIYLIFLLIAIIGICAGLGPNVSLGHKLITDHNYFYTIPYHIVPGYKALRIPMRWFLLASLGVSVFVSYGAMWLLDLLKGKYKKLQYLFVAIFAAWIIFEQFPTPIKTYENYQIKDYPAYQWLASQPGDFAILELPIFPGTSRHANDIIEARRMFLSTYHWKKRVSGAITPYIPDQYVQNARVLNAVGDNPDALTLLKSWQVQYIIFIPGDFATLGWGDDVRDSTKQRLDTMKDLSRVGTFNDTTIYKIKY